MEGYEALRLDFQTRLLSDGMSVEHVESVMNTFCLACKGFKIEKESCDIIPYGSVPKAVDEYIKSLQMEGRARGTIKNYEKVLKTMFITIKKPIEEVTHKDIWGFLLTYQASRERPVCNRTMNQYLGYIKYFFKWLQDIGYITSNPTRSIKPIHYEKKQRKSMTRRDLIQVMKACNNEKERAVISLMYATGCRISEMCAMQIKDIDWLNRRIKVMGKGKKERYVFFNDQAEIYLAEYLDTRKDDCEYVFVSARGHHHVTVDSMRKWIEGVCKRVTDISINVTPHTIRHTTATLGIASGIPVTSMQKILGHEQLSTTMEYVDMDRISIQQDYDKHVL